ncbi:MAG: hypothetical protein GVY10_09275 [Verrucomicrobia bacterium]|jgi:putative flippase GtrA|nr:hypothetical protein [Verrucomicrobiota bacterium]
MAIDVLKTRARDSRVLRYVAVGGFLFLIDLGVVYTLVVGFGINPGLGQLFGRTTGALTGFFLHRNFTFRSPTGRYRVGMAGQGGGYILLGITTILVSPFILLAMLTITNQRLVIAKFLTEVVIVVGNYLVLRLVFHHREEDHG